MELEREKAASVRLEQEAAGFKKKIQDGKEREASITELSRKLAVYEREAMAHSKDIASLSLMVSFSIKELSRKLTVYEREAIAHSKDKKRLKMQILALRKLRQRRGFKSWLPWYRSKDRAIVVPTKKVLETQSLNMSSLVLNGTVEELNATIKQLWTNNTELMQEVLKLRALVEELNCSENTKSVQDDPEVKRTINGLLEAQDATRLHAEARIEAAEARSSMLRDKLSEKGHELQASQEQLLREQQKRELLSHELDALKQEMESLQTELQDLEKQKELLTERASELRVEGEEMSAEGHVDCEVGQENAVLWAGWLEKRGSLSILRFSSVNQYQWRYVVVKRETLQIWSPPVDARSTKSSFPGRFLRMVTGKLEATITDGIGLAQRLDETGFTLKATVPMRDILKCEPTVTSACADNGFAIVTAARTWRFKASLPGTAASLVGIVESVMEANTDAALDPEPVREEGGERPSTDTEGNCLGSPGMMSQDNEGNQGDPVASYTPPRADEDVSVEGSDWVPDYDAE